MRFRFILLIGLAAIVIAGAIAFFVLRQNLGSIIAAAIERYGSRMMGTEVTVGSVDVALREGRLTIHGLHVANPEGFSPDDALSLGQLTFQIKLSSLRARPYDVERLVVDDPEALYEIAADGRRNLDVIRDNIEAYSGGEAPAGEKEPPLLIVRLLEFSAGKLQLNPAALGLESRSLDLPAFRLQDLGAPDGEPATAVAKEAVLRLLRQAAESAAIRELQDQATEKLGGDALDKARSILQGLGK
jgi:hypothetical protein